MITTTTTNAMHPPMIPHNALSERPAPRAPAEGDSVLSPVVVSVDSVAGAVAAEQI